MEGNGGHWRILWIVCDANQYQVVTAGAAKILDVAGKRSLSRPRRMWEANVEVDFKEIVCEDGRWKEMTQDRVQ
jgi:hypothetical protein